MKDHYDHTCLCCGRHEPEIVLTLDHIHPLARGGIHCECKKGFDVECIRRHRWRGGLSGEKHNDVP